MLRIAVALMMTGLLAAEVGKYGVEEIDEVTVLTKDNFADFVKNHKYVFVKFYAPWCGHCKSMAAGYSNLSKRLKAEDNGDGVVIAKVDATVEGELGEKFGVKGYPTLKFFVDGTPIDYSGAREEEAIYTWIQKKSGPSTKELKELSEVTALESNKIAVLFVTAGDNTEQLANFNSLATAYDDVSFYYTHNNEVKSHYSLTNANTLIVFRNFDEGKKTTGSNSNISTEELKNFLETHRHPFVMDFEQEAAEKIFGGEQTAIFVFNDNKDSEAVKAFQEVAKTKPAGLIFSYSTITTGLGARLAEYLGVTDKDTDTVRIIKFAAGNLLKYKLTKVTVEDLKKFIADFNDNKLNAYFKSEKIPEKNDEPVKVIVGDNFDQEVINNDKHVLLEAYAPWCGHCKKLEPIYTELATKLAAFPDIVIAKMDATANEHSSLNVKGFPTIKFFKKGSNGVAIDFEGDRTLEGFLKFLEKQTGLNLSSDAEKAAEDL